MAFRLSESTIAVDSEYVAKLRKDFLTLIKNVGQVSTASKVDEFDAACIAFGNLLEKIFDLAKEELNNVKFRTRWDNALISDVEYLLNNGGKDFWRFATDIRSVPGAGRKFFDKYEAPYYATKEQADSGYVFKFTGRAKQWEAKLRRTAPKAWKWLSDAAKVISRDPHADNRGLTVDTGVGQIKELEGFSAVLSGFDDSQFAIDNLHKFQAGLRVFKQAAKKRFPEMLRAPTFFLEFRGSGSASYSANWRPDRITVSIWGMSDKPPVVAKTIAHEIAHGIYRQQLNAEARKAWSNFVKGEYADLDLRKVLNDIGDEGWLHDPDVYKNDPLMYIGVASLGHDRAYNFERGSDIRQWLEKGNDPIAKVSKYPISAYAGKNEEEAFCEALSLSVVYGSKTVLPEVRQMLGMLLPRLRVESFEKEILRGIDIANDPSAGLSRLLSEMAMLPSLVSLQKKGNAKEASNKELANARKRALKCKTPQEARLAAKSTWELMGKRQIIQIFLDRMDELLGKKYKVPRPEFIDKKSISWAALSKEQVEAAIGWLSTHKTADQLKQMLVRARDLFRASKTKDFEVRVKVYNDAAKRWKELQKEWRASANARTHYFGR